ncbi:MAG: DUF1810 domain-containing protein [Nibricoccus sp.]
MAITKHDPFDLERFVTAQNQSYETALNELRCGAKQSHWIWYIFPQVAGLGFSTMSVRYAVKSKAEAKAYLAHPLLGQRLLECADALLRLSGKTAHEVMGSPDDLKLKLHSSMTLFAAISPMDSLFHKVLERYFDGKRDLATERFLKDH